MYVCTYIHIIPTHIYSYIYTCMNVRVYAYIYLYVRMYACIFIYISIHLKGSVC